MKTPQQTTLKVCSAPTIERLERLINQFFYSTSYKVNPDTLELTLLKGTNQNYLVRFERNKFVMYQK